MKRITILLCILLLVPALLIPEAAASADGEIYVGPDMYKLESYYEDDSVSIGVQRVHFINCGPEDAKNVRAVVSSKPDNTTITYPDGNPGITFGDIPAGGSAWSKTTYQVTVDKTYTPQPPPSQGIVWTIEYDDINGHHVISGVPEFPPD